MAPSDIAEQESLLFLHFSLSLSCYPLSFSCTSPFFPDSAVRWIRHPFSRTLSNQPAEERRKRIRWHEVETRNRDFDRESTLRCNVNAPVGQWASAKRHRPLLRNADSCEEELQKLGANIAPRVDRFGWFSRRVTWIQLRDLSISRTVAVFFALCVNFMRVTCGFCYQIQLKY